MKELLDTSTKHCNKLKKLVNKRFKGSLVGGWDYCSTYYRKTH